MDKRILNSLGLVALAAALLAIWGLFGLTRDIDLAAQKLGNSAPGPTAQAVRDADQGVLDTTAAMRDITIALLRPCKLGKPETCGLIPSLKTIAPPTVVAVNSLNASAGNLGSAADALRGMASQATVLLKTTDKALDDKDVGLKASLTRFDSLMGALTTVTFKGGAVAGDIDDMLKSQAVRAIPVSVAAITGTGAHMLDTADQVETKATHDYLHPSANPWKRAWDATEPWLRIGGQLGADFLPAVR